MTILNDDEKLLSKGWDSKEEMQYFTLATS
jgi:hypothetical protein